MLKQICTADSILSLQTAVWTPDSGHREVCIALKKVTTFTQKNIYMIILLAAIHSSCENKGTVTVYDQVKPLFCFFLFFFLKMNSNTTIQSLIFLFLHFLRSS